MDDVVKDFLVESYENLDRLDRDFVELEKNPSTETLGSIFRAIHTIKGTCGFLGFSKLESVAHAGENLLSRLRDKTLPLNQPIIDALLAMVDAVREMLASIETSENEGERADSALIETLHRLQSGAASPTPAPVTAPQSSSEAPKVALENMSIDDLERLLEERAKNANEPPPAPKLGELLVQKGEASTEQVEQALAEQSKGDPRRVGEILVQHGAVKPVAVLESIQSQSKTNATVSDSTVRVDVALLDKLMNLVGELVLARNQIMQFAAGQEDTTFLASSQHLNLVTGELQEGVMKTRMQPIGNVWNKIPRVVRDLANGCGKQVRVDMEGADTELDRTIIEAIKDPLTHVVRNSIDHGIESPQARLAAGKPAEGRILMRAFHEGGQVNIEIIDDGGGIDAEKIRDKALQKGLITAEQAERMSEREMVHLIFQPGFSTAEKVTNVSGRGVGMDVVKTNVEKIAGTVDVQSKLGAGTTLKVKIPLTLAIIPALMVTSGGNRYAIPQVNLLELVRLDGEQARKGVEMVHGAPVYRLRGNLLPLVFLDRELNLPAEPTDTEQSSINIVVLQADRRQFGLVVQAINDSKDIVVKPLGKHLKGLSVFSGATIMGNGKVSLILDIIGLSQRANVVSEARGERTESEAVAMTKAGEAARQALIICRYGKDRRVAVPLAAVARLEEFACSAIEMSKSHDVVQYRGEIMPLIYLSQVLGAGLSADEPKENIEVVVYRQRNRSVGVVVEQIADIVEERVAIRTENRGGHFAGTAVVQGKVTDILDLRAVIESVDPEYLMDQEAA